jgi:hypothetical protein
MRKHGMNLISLSAAFLLSLMPTFVSAAQLYSDDELNKKLRRVEKNIRYTVEEDIAKHVEPKHAEAVRGLTIELPLRGETPLDFSAIGK